MSKTGFTVKILRDVSPSTFTELKRRVGFSGKEIVRVGVPDKPHKGDEKGTPLSTIAAAHEFGVPSHNIPERPFLRPSLRIRKQDLIQINRINLIKVVNGKLTIAQALSQLGSFAAGAVKQYIRRGIKPDLKESTILARGRTSKKAARAYKKTGDLEALQSSVTPLIDTGQLIQSITFEVTGRDKDV